MKKLWKKLVAVTTAVMMAITLLPAMANAETPTGTVNIIKHGADTSNTLPGAQFTLYKLASVSNEGEWTYTVESNYESILGVNQYQNLNSLPVKTWESSNIIEALDKKIVANNIAGIETNETQANGIATISNLEMGVYLVRETKTPDTYVAGKPFIVSIPQINETGDLTWNITAEPKNSQVPITKVADKKNVGIGDTVSYKLSTTIPYFGKEYTNAKFNVYDTLSEGLKLVADSVTVTGISKDSYDVITDGDELNGKTFIVKFKSDKILDLTKDGTPITITYQATVTEKAKYENNNTAGVQYSNKPGEEQGSNTTEEKVYTYGIDLNKTGDKANAQDGLDGAEFTLTKDNTNGDQTEMKIVIVNGEVITVKGYNITGKATATYEGKTGKLVFYGLSAGTYTLTETKAPQGYSLAKNPITIVITAKEDGSIDLDNTTVNGTKAENVTNGIVPVGLENKSGFNLPATGGMGTYLFTIAGLVIMAGAAFLLIASRKRRA